MGPRGPGTNSLSTALNLIGRHLKGSAQSRERKAALSLVSDIRKRAIQNRTPELDYVRYLRNKWAAHSTMDRAVDPWEAGKSVDFAKLENGLEQMRQHFHELATLVAMVKSLGHLEDDGRRLTDTSYRMGLAWDGFSHIASQVMTPVGEDAAKQLMDRIEPALMAAPH